MPGVLIAMMVFGGLHGGLVLKEGVTAVVQRGADYGEHQEVEYTAWTAPRWSGRAVNRQCDVTVFGLVRGGEEAVIVIGDTNLGIDAAASRGFEVPEGKKLVVTVEFRQGSEVVAWRELKFRCEQGKMGSGIRPARVQ